MAKVIMTCGRICSGKSTYAQNIKEQLGGVILSIDELMLDILGGETGDKHDEYVRRTEKYLYKKSVEIVSSGTDVILDWGFWKKSDRDFAREFYREHGISCEFHYIGVDDDEWKRRIEKRNAEVQNGRSDAYLIDEVLAAKFESLFEVPDISEMDIWI
ncbi:MAG: ATP-binding protein [Ruminococcus sp.]|uniref:AAA family ATPase n=1 Tax=Ruminococcus sp. TaxID=41978 RepID=UPI0025D3F5FA|nr:ATP-binding protein [Ruminococcus sp.]MCR4794161.1 ATP-binding protein [Ruminococcus sp.]